MVTPDDLWEGAKVQFTSARIDATTGDVKYLRSDGQAIVQPDGHPTQITLEIAQENLRLLPEVRQ